MSRARVILFLLVFGILLLVGCSMKNDLLFTLSILEPKGQGTTDPDSGEYLLEIGTTVTLKAESAEGWEFEKWEVNGEFYSDEPETSLMMDEDKEVQAFFKSEPPSEELEVSGIDVDGEKPGMLIVEFSREIFPSDGDVCADLEVLVGEMPIGIIDCAISDRFAELELALPCLVGASVAITVNGVGLAAGFDTSAELLGFDLVLGEGRYELYGEMAGDDLDALTFRADLGLVLPGSADALPVEVFIKEEARLLVIESVDEDTEVIEREVHLIPAILCAEAEWLETVDLFGEKIEIYKLTIMSNLPGVIEYELSSDDGEVFPESIEYDGPVTVLEDFFVEQGTSSLRVIARGEHGVPLSYVLEIDLESP